MTPSQPSLALPPLREDLQLIAGKKNSAGEQTWRLYDPLQHRFIEADSTTVEILSLWRTVADAKALRDELATSHGVSISLEAIDDLIKFARANQLTSPDAPGDWRKIAERARKSQKGLFHQLLHNYLFFRIPLVHPQRFLVATLAYVEPLFSRRVHLAIALLGLIGLYLVSRQWDQFINTFQHFFTLEGAFWVACTLFIVKALHELGHAYTAIRLGCEVPSAGLAFMLMTPMLYTDVTDAWRLPLRRQRMQIDFAGVAVELMIACICAFLWPFFPEGKFKSLAFLLATSSILMSLAVNLSPFMRFDGYYILADMLGVPNLQSRAFELARWKLREVLFGLDDVCPEEMPRRRIIGLIIYAVAVWIYRFSLYLGIALVVYSYFFKALGILLFVVEILVFLVGPFFSEAKIWWQMKSRILSRRQWLIPATALGALACAAVVPWSTRIDIPVIVEPSALARVYPPKAAKIASIHAFPGDTVRSGTILLKLTSDALEYDIKSTRMELEKTRAQLARLVADGDDRQNLGVLSRELLSHQTKLDGLRREAQELVIRAPIGGRIVELNPNLTPGRTMSLHEPVAVIADETHYEARGFVAERDLDRLKPDDAAQVIPESLVRSKLAAKVRTVALKGASVIDIPELISTNGGLIAVKTDKDRQATPVSSVYAVTFDVDAVLAKPDARFRGVAHVRGKPQSFAFRMWRQIATVLIREGGA